MRGVIFDWDGTLADSHSSLYEANAAVMRELRLPFSEELYREHYAPDWRLMYQRLGVPADRVEDANRIWQAAFHGSHRPSLLPGARDALERLRDAGIAIALVTAGGRSTVEPQIVALGLTDLIPIRVFGDDQPEQKPHPAPLRRALAGLGLTPDGADGAEAAELAYLGDAPDDMRMAVAASCSAIGVISPLSDELLLREAGAQVVVASVADWVDTLLSRHPLRVPQVHALVIADGDRPDRAALDATWPGWLDDVGLVVAADGGAVAARALGLTIHLVVGDGDSLGPSGLAELAAAGVAIERSPADKDESDTELAVLACMARGASAITIIGAFGGRIDHELANIWLLALPALGARRVQLLDGRTRMRLIRAPAPDGQPASRELTGRPGDLVSLLPLGGDVEGITTWGLRYPLRDEPLRLGPARGLSNVRLAASARVSVRAGLLLVVESPAVGSVGDDAGSASRVVSAT